MRLSKSCCCMVCMDDNVIPFTSTSEAGTIMRNCGVRHHREVYYQPLKGHPDVDMELMLGGKTRRAVMDWLQKIDISSSLINCNFININLFVRSKESQVSP